MRARVTASHPTSSASPFHVNRERDRHDTAATACQRPAYTRTESPHKSRRPEQPEGGQKQNQAAPLERLQIHPGHGIGQEARHDHKRRYQGREQPRPRTVHDRLHQQRLMPIPPDLARMISTTPSKYQVVNAQGQPEPQGQCRNFETQCRVKPLEPDAEECDQRQVDQFTPSASLLESQSAPTHRGPGRRRHASPEPEQKSNGHHRETSASEP